MLWVSRSNPTYLRVYARQRPGGVVWDAVPLTVPSLNKAAGNLPLSIIGIVVKSLPLDSSCHESDSDLTMVGFDIHDFNCLAWLKACFCAWASES